MTASHEVSHKTGLRSFLIGDVRGYTRFTAEHGDEAAAHLAATFAGLARDAVEARGGRVIELRGDEVLAVFDVAAQSVRAARELQWTCAEEVARDPSLPLLVGIGIAAGEAVPVEEGYRGAALNLAARLCSTAAAGEVLVSAWLAELAGTIDGISFSDRGEVQLKGFPQAIPFFEVSGTRSLPPSAPHVEGSPQGLAPQLDTGLPLVGREHEARWARGTWRQARRGAGRVLMASGPSGIGKTRFAAEIAVWVEANGGRVRYAGAGGTAIADTLGAIEDAAATASPVLVILDDLDAAGEQAATALAQALDVIRRGPALVLALAQRTDASASLAALVEVIDVLGDGHRPLGALDLDGVREICRVYAGDEVAEAPVESIARSSGGVPGQVHESMSEWAREEASRRLEAAAEWLTVGRERRAAGLGFANNIIGLKLDRIYGIPDAIGAQEMGCPYKGLAPFGSDDAPFFFGREALVGELAARTVGVGLLGVVGASGSGKSSVVAAGLRSSLAAGLLPGSARWDQLTMRPGEHPLDELSSVLRTVVPDAGPQAGPLQLAEAVGLRERVVLYVDQFEEVFTTCEDAEEVSAFVDILTELATRPERVVVVLALRGDFYAHTAAHPTLAQMMASNHVLVGPMSQDELRRAIELPARRAGIHVESALVDRLVEDVGESPGGLPLLSTALVELWEQRSGGWLRLEAYSRTGGLHGAVARLAEQAYGELDDVEKEAAPSVLLRLVGPGEGEGVTRRRVPVDEFDLGSQPSIAGILRRFTRDRLLTADDQMVEVAHEALLREWPRLRTWLAEDAQGRELRVHLTGAARLWQRDGEEDSELYRGARLSAALDWAAQHDRLLNDLERSFLAASRARSERDVERQRRTNRRLRGLLVGVAVFLVFALVAGSVALVQRGRAQSSAVRANESATQALAQSLGARGFAQPQLSRALLMATEGVNLAPSDETDGFLLSTLLRTPSVLHTYTTPETERPLEVGPVDDGRILGVGMNSGDVSFYDVATGAQLGSHASSDGSNVICCQSAPDGDAIALMQQTGFFGPAVLDPRTGATVRRFSKDPFLNAKASAGLLFAYSVAESADGRSFFLAYSAGRPSGAAEVALPSWVDRWDTTSGRLLARSAPTTGNGHRAERHEPRFDGLTRDRPRHLPPGRRKPSRPERGGLPDDGLHGRDERQRDDRGHRSSSGRGGRFRGPCDRRDNRGDRRPHHPGPMGGLLSDEPRPGRVHGRRRQRRAMGCPDRAGTGGPAAARLEDHRLRLPHRRLGHVHRESRRHGRGDEPDGDRRLRIDRADRAIRQRRGSGRAGSRPGSGGGRRSHPDSRLAGRWVRIRRR